MDRRKLVDNKIADSIMVTCYYQVFGLCFTDKVICLQEKMDRRKQIQEHADSKIADTIMVTCYIVLPSFWFVFY